MVVIGTGSNSKIHVYKTVNLASPKSNMSDFGTNLLDTFTKSGLAWVQTTGCIYIIYGFFISNQMPIWRILLAHGVSGLIGIFIENCFVASKLANPDLNIAFLLGINEIMWIIHEASTVYYSFVKLQIAILDPKHKRVLRGILGILFLGFSGCRINIGRLRVMANLTMNTEIAAAHSYAFIFWGLADIVIFGLLAYNIYAQISVVNHSTMHLVVTLLKSSVPRLLVLVVNTLLIVIIGQISDPNSNIKNLNSLVWAIKGTYPIILLFDIHTTKDMLIHAASNISHRTGQTQQTTQHLNVFDVNQIEESKTPNIARVNTVV
ncbi:hypothetical protein BC833DRAFT_577723 [Globomyces pollinis-pini]|nr:hypothetical protein BC833DRAFT_577723 [Globomyces pollinis-pini]